MRKGCWLRLGMLGFMVVVVNDANTVDGVEER
jgi:hypothetical protein